MLCGVAVWGSSAAPAPVVAPQRYSLPEAERLVGMLNDFYQLNIRQIHHTYVKEATVAPAGAVTREIMRDMTEKGWPVSHWLSVNGKALNPANRARDRFEREAARRLRAGAETYAEIEANTLRTVTRVNLDGPCIRCHFGIKPSQLVCGIQFKVPLKPGAAAEPAVHPK